MKKKKLPRWVKCSHKSTEYLSYLDRKIEGDGVFPPIKHCSECELAKKLKVNNI